MRGGHLTIPAELAVADITLKSSVIIKRKKVQFQINSVERRKVCCFTFSFLMLFFFKKS